MQRTGLFSLASKTAIVTGAASGIGQAIAALFARQGAHVEILDCDAANGEAAAQAIRQDGGSAQFQPCDVSDAEDVRCCVDAVFAARGRIDILVNNAAVAHVGSLLQTSEADLDRLYAINVKGMFHCMKACVEKMAQAGGGVILNLASIAALTGLKERFAYSMTKGAVPAMTYSVAADYIDRNIRCNCICPARIHTPLVDGYLRKNYPGREAEMFKTLSQAQPMGRMGTPDEVAALALYLCSDEAAFVTGCAYPIDGGVLGVS